MYSPGFFSVNYLDKTISRDGWKSRRQTRPPSHTAQFLGIEGVGGIDRGGEAGTVVQIADPISCMVDLCFSPHHWGCADCGVYRPRHVNTYLLSPEL